MVTPDSLYYRTLLSYNETAGAVRVSRDGHGERAKAAPDAAACSLEPPHRPYLGVCPMYVSPALGRIATFTAAGATTRRTRTLVRSTRPAFLLRTGHGWPCTASLAYRQHSPPLPAGGRRVSLAPFFVQKKNLSSSSISQSAALSASSDLQAMPRINITPQEEMLFTLLDAVAKHLTASKSAGSETELRIAGGWVRDKLLGRDCHDLDISINNMVGYDFAKALCEYIASHEGDAPTKSRVGKISSNPERSKHLETATMKIAGLACDFVNLRSEKYTENSRIPSMTFGTPVDDAYRRDITINALYFNVHTREVEDHTGKGLQDLREGVIRTPLPSRETFRDDPLRILRVLRFASRFRFRMVDDILDSIRDVTIKEALSAKISKERIFIEVDKMLRGPDPVQSVNYICDLGLYPVLFAQSAKSVIQDAELPSFDQAVVRAAQTAVRVIEWLTSHFADDPLSPFRLQEPLSREDLRQLYLTALFLPLHDVLSKFSVSGESFKLVTRATLCLSTFDTEVVTSLLVNSARVEKAVAANAQTPLTRSDIGVLLRELASVSQIKGRWIMNVVFAIVRQLGPYVQPENWQPWKAPLPDAVSSIISQYAAFIQCVSDMGLQECWKWKHIINGHMVMETLSLSAKCAIHPLMADIMVWQLDHPEETPEQCKAWLKEKWGPHVEEIRNTRPLPRKKRKKLQA